jgi:putative transposase
LLPFFIKTRHIYLKVGHYYNKHWTGITINQFIKQFDEYIKWYAEKRIKLSLGGMSPLDYRKSLGLAV